jgi:hypothetical protein
MRGDAPATKRTSYHPIFQQRDLKPRVNPLAGAGRASP